MDGSKKLVEEITGKIKTGENQLWKTESVLL